MVTCVRYMCVCALCVCVCFMCECKRECMMCLLLAYLVVQKHAGARLEEVLVDKGCDGNIVLGPVCRGNDRVIVVNDLLQVAHRHGRTTDLIHLASVSLHDQWRTIPIQG
jgi:hypothetical protein